MVAPCRRWSAWFRRAEPLRELLPFLSGHERPVCRARLLAQFLGASEVLDRSLHVVLGDGETREPEVVAPEYRTAGTEDTELLGARFQRDASCGPGPWLRRSRS